MDIVFVILHYKTYNDTEDCVESIKNKIDSTSYHIIIVDNFSNNGSLEKLKDKYKNDNDITILCNTENLGFAKGLNTGIYYARKNYETKYIAVINNDVILISDDFIHRLDTKMNEYNFSLCGPMIITKDGSCTTNPIRNTIRSKDEVEKCIKKYKKLYKLCRIKLFNIYRIMKKTKKVKKECYLSDQINYKLHGSFWVFSERFFDDFKGLDEDTFLYGEEDILYLHLMKHNHITLYTPSIIIYHKEDAATNEAIPNNSQKMQFVCKNCINSLNIYLKLLEKYEGEKNEYKD